MFFGKWSCSRAESIKTCIHIHVHIFYNAIKPFTSSDDTLIGLALASLSVLTEISLGGETGLDTQPLGGGEHND